MPAPVCTPLALLEDASCLTCLSQQQLLAIIAWILCNGGTPMADCTPQTLLTEASCLTCLSSQQLLAIIAYLLCTGAGGGGAGVTVGVVDPNGAVACATNGALYINRLTSSLWYCDTTLGIWIALIV